MAFWEGLLWGLGMIIFIGPVFFTLLKSSLQEGQMAGLSVAVGIIVSDIVAVALCLGTVQAVPFLKDPENQYYIGIAGSILLFGMGSKYLIAPNMETNHPVHAKTNPYFTYFIKGFLINFVNPFVFLVWISLITYGRDKYGSSVHLGLFLSAVLLGIFTTDSLKAIFAHQIKPLIKPGTLIWVYRFFGVIMIGFGVRMLWYVFHL